MENKEERERETERETETETESFYTIQVKITFDLAITALFVKFLKRKYT